MKAKIISVLAIFLFFNIASAQDNLAKHINIVLSGKAKMCFELDPHNKDFYTNVFTWDAYYNGKRINEDVMFMAIGLEEHARYASNYRLNVGNLAASGIILMASGAVISNSKYKNNIVSPQTAGSVLISAGIWAIIKAVKLERLKVFPFCVAENALHEL